ncbi:hypothetical protein Zm00014a_016867 [Zea mays]|uniref:Uncharacterized protein n=1 Tax=Zea mays TaxID=4577 RepID=A0A3L6DBE3_MAIZE|nr:hypothetical protein Zm00014a_016867 [Zea mays]
MRVRAGGRGRVRVLCVLIAQLYQCVWLHMICSS